MVVVIYTSGLLQEREMEMRRHALEEERQRREELEKRLQEETSRRQKLVEREVKLREKQRSQVTRRGPQILWEFFLFFSINHHQCLNYFVRSRGC